MTRTPTDFEPRDLELILLHNGGAELVDFSQHDDGLLVWASDSDNDFREDFPDFLGEGDVERIQDWLVEAEYISSEEADDMEISIEALETANASGPGDDEEDDGDDDD